MLDIACPTCGEEDRLEGERKDDAIVVTCLECRTKWRRDAVPKCVHCRSTNLEYHPLPLFSAGRGTMRTATGKRDAWNCRDCGVADATRKPDETP